MSNRAAALRRALAPVLLVCLAAMLAATATDARADAFGQLERWGAQGTDPGQFSFSNAFGVDPGDDSVFVIDYDAGGDFRLQKISKSGDPLGSTTIPMADGGLIGIAVDTDADRAYLLQHEMAPTGRATRLLAFSTVPDVDRRLVLSQTVTLPVDASTPISPAALTLDPVSDDLVIASESATGKLVVQHFSTAGVAGRRYEDTTGEAPLNASSLLTGLAIGPDGATYVSTGSNNAPLALYQLDAGFTRAARLTLPSVGEGWKPYAAGIPFDYFGTSPGSQLTIDADGLLYWTEAVAPDASPTPGNYIVRGYSPAEGKTKIVYGGGTGDCRITRTGAAVAASGRDLFVLDHAPFEVPAPYGEQVLLFGAGGSGCPVPRVALTINASREASTTVVKGQQVTFDASAAAGTDLNGATVEEAAWDFDGSGAFAVSGRDLRVTHRFVRAGRVTVSLRIRLSGSLTGDPEVLTRTVDATSPAPTAAFTASPRTVAAGGEVAFDAAASFDPAGTDDARPSNQLPRYRWEFGDGTTVTTTTATVRHAYANPAADALSRTVKLTVTNRDGIDSASVSQTVTVQGTPVDPPPPPPDDPNRGRTTEQPPPLVVPPPVAPKVALRGVRATGAGVVGLTVTCPAGTTACSGTVALTATVRVAARSGKGRRARARAQTIALGSVSFTVAAGGSRAISVRLSARGRGLFAKSRRLKIALRATTTAGSATATTTASATIALPRRARRAKK